MKNNLLFLFLFTFTLFNAFGQQGSIQGKVTSKSNQPIADVNIMISGTNLGATTTKSGRFSIHQVEPGNYILVVSSIGYSTVSEKV
ncbi:MAG: carboxypeptidase-like regulatory domain-containing protein, partial [Allomuricauda sp.]